MMTNKIDPFKETESIVAMVRRFKEEYAAEFGLKACFKRVFFKKRAIC